MKEKKSRKLVLNKRTLAMLSGEELGNAAGGRKMQVADYCTGKYTATCPDKWGTTYTWGCPF